MVLAAGVVVRGGGRVRRAAGGRAAEDDLLPGAGCCEHVYNLLVTFAGGGIMIV